MKQQLQNKLDTAENGNTTETEIKEPVYSVVNLNLRMTVETVCLLLEALGAIPVEDEAGNIQLALWDCGNCKRGQKYTYLPTSQRCHTAHTNAAGLQIRLGDSACRENFLPVGVNPGQWFRNMADEIASLIARKVR